MRRVQLFEVHDLPACPGFVREGIVEALGEGLRLGRVYDGAGEPFARFLDEARCDEVLDVCSGSGQPAAILLDALRRSGRRLPRFAISDLYPNLGAMRRVQERWGDRIEVIEEPVDATRVPEHVDRPARTITSAFHHFPPPLAARILGSAIERRRALFLLEPSGRSLRFFAVMPVVAAALWSTTLTARRERWKRILFSFGVPAIPLAGLWDAVISMLRMYDREELDAMVREASGYTWTHAEAPFFPGGRALVFYGVPRAGGAEPATAR